MNVSCPKCETVFRVDPAKVPVRGIRARCSSCAAVFFVGRPSEPEPVGVPPAPVATAPAFSPPPQPAPVAGSGAAPSSSGPARPAVTPPTSSPPARPVAPAAATAPPPPAVGPRSGMPPVAPPVAPPAATPTPPRPAMEPPSAPATRPQPQAAPVFPTPTAAPPVFSAPAAATAPRRPVNPFLSTDPATKARRLARALISDLVVYHPGKRADGLRDGTLKLLFEDEIRKCWEEYTEQVGMEMATSTQFFTEALNEILADGQPVFS